MSLAPFPEKKIVVILNSFSKYLFVFFLKIAFLCIILLYCYKCNNLICEGLTKKKVLNLTIIYTMNLTKVYLFFEKKKNIFTKGRGVQKMMSKR